MTCLYSRAKLQGEIRQVLAAVSAIKIDCVPVLAAGCVLVSRHLVESAHRGFPLL
jgi:hypothetical protein